MPRVQSFPQVTVAHLVSFLSTGKTLKRLIMEAVSRLSRAHVNRGARGKMRSTAVLYVVLLLWIFLFMCLFTCTFSFLFV